MNLILFEEVLEVGLKGRDLLNLI